MRRVFIISFLFVLFVGGVLVAQNNTNSPYTRYGYGRLDDPAFGRCLGMGGLSIGLRGNSNVNPANPASYSAVDSMTFIFDMGISGSLSRFASAGSQRTTGTGNLDYLAIQFSATKWMGVSFGLMPYSSVGYDFGSIDSVFYDSNYLKYSQKYKGSGGISQVYLGLSFNLWKRLSIGANAYFLWGEMLHNRKLDLGSSYYSSDITANLHVRSFNFRYGLQYTERIAKKHVLTLGLAYENRSRLRGTYEEMLIDVDTMIISKDSPLQLPSFYGAGISYNYDDRLTIGVDYSLYEFSKAKSFNVNSIDSLNNRHKWVLGAEYIHDPNGLRYVDRMRWRLGGDLTTSYISPKVIDYGITIGVGFPLKTAKTILNVAFEYDKIGKSAKGFIREDYFKLSFNATINETWFFKSKIR